MSRLFHLSLLQTPTPPPPPPPHPFPQVQHTAAEAMKSAAVNASESAAEAVQKAEAHKAEALARVEALEVRLGEALLQASAATEELEAERTHRTTAQSELAAAHEAGQAAATAHETQRADLAAAQAECAGLKAKEGELAQLKSELETVKTEAALAREQVRTHESVSGERDAAHRQGLEAARRGAAAAKDDAAKEVRAMKESVAGLEGEIERMRKKKAGDLEVS